MCRETRRNCTSSGHQCFTWTARARCRHHSTTFFAMAVRLTPDQVPPPRIHPSFSSLAWEGSGRPEGTLPRVSLKPGYETRDAWQAGGCCLGILRHQTQEVSHSQQACGKPGRHLAKTTSMQGDPGHPSTVLGVHTPEATRKKQEAWGHSGGVLGIHPPKATRKQREAWGQPRWGPEGAVGQSHTEAVAQDLQQPGGVPVRLSQTSRSRRRPRCSSGRSCEARGGARGRAARPRALATRSATVPGVELSFRPPRGPDQRHVPPGGPPPPARVLGPARHAARPPPGLSVPSRPPRAHSPAALPSGPHR